MLKGKYHSRGNPLIDAEDEGVGFLTDALRKLNWTGAGVVASEGAAGEVDILIPGATSGPAVPLIPSKEFYVDKNRVDVYVPNGSIQFPFKSVAAAIAGTVGSVAIHLTPDTYTEDITISRGGIHLTSHDTAQYRSGAQITGKCTVDIAANGSTYWSGITFFNDDDHTIDFTGVGDQKVFANNCAFRNESPGAHHCWNNTNTGDSELTAHDLIIRHTDVSGGGRAVHVAVGTDCVHRIWKGNIIIDTDSSICVECLGAGSFELNHEDVQGRMIMAGTVGMDIENTRLTSLAATVLDYTSTFALGSRMRNTQVITAISPAIIGTGLIHQSGTVWEFTGRDFDPLLTIVSTPWESADNVAYDPSTSLYPLVSTNVRDALDEIEGIVAALRVFQHPLGSHNSQIGDYDVLNISSNGDGNISFIIPDDFTALTSAELIGIPDGFANATANIDLDSSYAAVGEDFETHQESDVSSTYNIPVSDQVFALDISSVLSSLSAGDCVGMTIDHNTIGGSVGYIAIKLVYT